MAVADASGLGCCPVFPIQCRSSLLSSAGRRCIRFTRHWFLDRIADGNQMERPMEEESADLYRTSRSLFRVALLRHNLCASITQIRLVSKMIRAVS